MKQLKLKLGLRLLPMTLLLAGAINMNAQKKAMIGFRFMPSISSFKMNSSSGGAVSGTAVLGFGVGGVLGFNFSEHLGIQGEVIYNSISQKYKENNVERRVNLTYFNIPLLLAFNSGRYKMMNANLVIGPQFGVNMGSNLSTSGTDSAQAVVAIRKGDFGFAYGGGLDFGLNEKKSVRLALGFRGVYGLMDISNNSSSSEKNTYYIIDKTNVQTYSIYAGLTLLF